MYKPLKSAIAALLLLPLTAPAISVLSPGDVAVVGYNGKRPDDFSIVSLVNIDAGVQLRFDLTGAGEVNWTVPAGGIAAGTVVVVLNPRNDDTPSPIPATTTAGGTVVEGSYDYTSGGDALIVYQGTNAIFASENLSTAFSPPGALAYTNATVINHTSGTASANFNARYRNTAPRTGVRQQLLNNIADIANWEYNSADPSTAAFLNAAPYTNAFTISPGFYWTSQVLDGYYRRPGRSGLSRISSQITQLTTIRLDNNDATNTEMQASISDSIAARNWLSVLFTNTVPDGTGIASAKLYVQHQGKPGHAGNLQLNVSTNRTNSGWWNGGTGNADFVAADVAWNATESQSIFDVVSILNSPARLNNAEFLFLDRVGSSAEVYFDYMWLEAVYIGSGAPLINNDVGAGAVTASSANLNGTLVDGAPNPLVLIAWGDNIGTNALGSWDTIENLGVLGVGAFARPVSGLLANKTYYYRAYASNTLGEAWAPAHAAFTTLPPAVQFSTEFSTPAEANATIPIALSLNAPSTLPISVTVSVSGGSASTPADYTFAITNVTFPAGLTATNVNLTIAHDTVNEEDETVILALSAPVNATIGAIGQHTATILDNDAAPTLAYGATAVNANEAGVTAVVSVVKSAVSQRNVSVNYQTLDGDALAGSDYSNTVGSLTWPSGDTNLAKFIAVPMINDASPESVEQFFVVLAGPVNASISGTTTATVNLADDDLGPPSATLGLGPTLISSNAATLNGELLSAGGTPTTVRLHYGLTDGGSNVASWTSMLNLGVLPQGTFSNRVTGLTTNRTYFYRASASNAFGLVWAPHSTNFVTGPPTIRFVLAESEGPESSTPVVIDVSLSNPSVYGDDVSVNYRKISGTSSQGNDFTLPSTTLVIRAGTSLTNITVNILEDALSENNEGVNIAFQSVFRAFLASPTAHDYTILDNDPLPQIQFIGAPYTVQEWATNAIVQVKLNPVAGRSVDANYTTADGTALAFVDYQTRTGEVQWASGNTATLNVSIPIVNDGVSRGDRAFEFRLTPTGNDIDLTNVTDRATVTIIEDDFTAPQISNANGADGVRARMAVLNGRVLGGVPPPQVRIFWGTTDGGTTPAAWGRTNFVGTQTGAFAEEIYNLTPNTTYFYRCFATNSAGTAWATNTASFRTGTGTDYFVNDASTVNDVYCSAVGNDANPGTSAAAPKASMNAIASAYDLAPGDTVYIDTGAYTLSATFTPGSDDVGSAGTGSNVLYRGSPHPDGTVIARGTLSADAIVLPTLGGNLHMAFEKLRITGARRAFVAVGSAAPNYAQGLIIRDCTIYETVPSFPQNQAAVLIRNYTNAWVVGCNIHSNAEAGLYFNLCVGSGAASNTIAANGTRGIRSLNVPGATYAFNTLAGHAGYGLLMESGGGGEQILGNAVYSNAVDGINLIGFSATIGGNHLFGNGADGLKLSGSGYTVTGNTIEGNAGNGIEAPGDNGPACINNLIYNNADTNVVFIAPNNRVRFEHNTVYGGSGVFFQSPFAVTNRNNIIWARGTGALALHLPGAQPGGFVSDYNCLRADNAAILATLSDDAANAAYDGGWDNGSGAGLGFGPWIFTSSGPPSGTNAFFFNGSSLNNAANEEPGIDTAGRAWGMNASGGSYATAYRLASLPVGATLKLAIDNGYVDNGQTVGFVLRNGNAASGTGDYNVGARFEFFFLGGSANYAVVDSLGQRNTGVPFTATGLQLALTLGTNDTYTFRMVNAAGTTNTLTGSLKGTAASSIDSIAIYNRNAGSGTARDAFFNSLQITTTNAAAWGTASQLDANSIGADPLFVDVANGDFHLQSLAGSYHGGIWLADANNSPAIDAAAPTAAFANEPAYNGLRANLGMEGNTAEASKTHYTGAFYTVAITSAPPAYGTAFISPAATLYPTNVPVTIWAAPASTNYTWQGWTGSLVTATITNTFFVTTNLNLIATFAAGTDTNYAGAYYTLTLNRTPVEAGAVFVNPVLASYPTNIPVTIWATLTNAAYAWVGWTGGIDSVSMTNVIYVTSNMTCLARFTAAVNNTNGVPGSWLTAYGIPDTQAGADADTDADGHRNWQEYYAGTIPTNKASVLKSTFAARTGNQRDSLSFLSTTGKLYRVQLSSNLISRVWVYWPAATTSNGAASLTPITATATTMTVYMDPPSNAHHYRLDLNY